MHRPHSSRKNKRRSEIVHEMRLNDAPFNKIDLEEKDIELRLYDEKHRRLNVNDIIIFSHSYAARQIAVRIISLHRYASFEQLFHDFTPDRCGFENETSAQDAAQQMGDYYSPEVIDTLGVIGIGVEKIDLLLARGQQLNGRERLLEKLFPDGLK